LDLSIGAGGSGLSTASRGAGATLRVPAPRATSAAGRSLTAGLLEGRASAEAVFGFAAAAVSAGLALGFAGATSAGFGVGFGGATDFGCGAGFSLLTSAFSGLAAGFAAGAAGKLPGLACATARAGLSHSPSQTGKRATSDRITKA
jgi:hypothetical protein